MQHHVFLPLSDSPEGWDHAEEHDYDMKLAEESVPAGGHGATNSKGGSGQTKGSLWDLPSKWAPAKLLQELRDTQK